MLNKYPLWKNFLLVVAALVGLLYAIPNLYSEDPVVQVSSPNHAEVESLQSKVQALLQTASISYLAIEPTSDGVEVRFKTTDAQLLARDAIKDSLNSSYTVALNLVPSTPAWL